MNRDGKTKQWWISALLLIILILAIWLWIGPANLSTSDLDSSSNSQSEKGARQFGNETRSQPGAKDAPPSKLPRKIIDRDARRLRSELGLAHAKAAERRRELDEMVAQIGAPKEEALSEGKSIESKERAKALSRELAEKKAAYEDAHARFEELKEEYAEKRGLDSPSSEDRAK